MTRHLLTGFLVGFAHARTLRERHMRRAAEREACAERHERKIAQAELLIVQRERDEEKHCRETWEAAPLGTIACTCGGVRTERPACGSTAAGIGGAPLVCDMPAGHGGRHSMAQPDFPEYPVYWTWDGVRS